MQFSLSWPDPGHLASCNQVLCDSYASSDALSVAIAQILPETTEFRSFRCRTHVLSNTQASQVALYPRPLKILWFSNLILLYVELYFRTRNVIPSQNLGQRWYAEESRKYGDSFVWPIERNYGGMIKEHTISTSRMNSELSFREL